MTVPEGPLAADEDVELEIEGVSIDDVDAASDPVPLPTCPGCHWTLDGAGRCPKCFDRLCEDCGKLTGSYLIRNCGGCGQALDSDPK
jgi:hypothetical protein